MARQPPVLNALTSGAPMGGAGTAEACLRPRSSAVCNPDTDLSSKLIYICVREQRLRGHGTSWRLGAADMCGLR